MQLIGPDRPLFVVEVELGRNVHQLDVGIVKGIDGADVAPVVLRARLDVGKRIGNHVQQIDRRRDHVLAEIMRRLVVGRVGDQQFLQQPGVEHVDAHGGERDIRSGRDGLGLLRFLGELGDAVPVGD